MVKEQTGLFTMLLLLALTSYFIMDYIVLQNTEQTHLCATLLYIMCAHSNGGNNKKINTKKSNVISTSCFLHCCIIPTFQQVQLNFSSHVQSLSPAAARNKSTAVPDKPLDLLHLPRYIKYMRHAY